VITGFTVFIQMPAGRTSTPAVIAACRAGGVGIINGEFEANSASIAAEIELVSANVRTPFGLKVDAIDSSLSTSLRVFASRGLGWLIAEAHLFRDSEELFRDLRRQGLRVLAQITTSEWPAELSEESVDGLVLKGNEAGGFVGEDSSFVLLQKWLGKTNVPLFLHGGLTPQVAAACHACGVAGGIFDSQVLLLEDLNPPKSHQALFEKLSGSETAAVGDGERGEYFRILVRPGHNAARTFTAEGEGRSFTELRSMVAGKLDWDHLRTGLLPVGQDVCFAGTWRKQYRNLPGLLRAVGAALEQNLRTAVRAKTISTDAPLAKAWNIGLPIVQGPMTRVSDRAEFARLVAEAGALPMVAFALLKGTPLEEVLTETTRLLGRRPWGIGLLGFAPQALLDEQLSIALRFSPHYAIIAGGRPDQVVQLEKAGIPSFLHVPAANLIPLFLSEGARRFIFEGRECGGHIGPLSSFVLWSTMVDKLLVELEQRQNEIRPDEIQLLFAGGIHDAVSSAMVQVLVAPLAAQGVKIGILMGSAYLFTREIVASGAIVPRFQQEVLACDRTVNLTSGPGHASRCAYTPFAREFFRTRKRLEREGVAADEGRKVLDDLIMGRLRIASKGLERNADNGQLETIDESRQHSEGMYMLGQVATLRDRVTDVRTLHDEVTEGAAALLAARLYDLDETVPSSRSQPADVAIVGIASLLPKANSTIEYWDNILENVDAITEIPRHRWDWRLYFDADRNAKDKIYSKWGGFLDDLVFDPAQYGMPPRSVQSVDPMQLIALEVARRTLVDAGYADRAYDHDRTSIIIGASGGTGDVGTQYGLRAELPRFTGELPDAVADRLPEWTEDSFAGILSNVIAGRVANRLNFGGVNFTADAACASSLAALYQGISELTAGRSDLVIAGGVDTVQGPFGYLCFSKTQALSPRGRCMAFDASSDGIVISEGVAMVALKRLADAERDGDRIYAVIKGIGGSSDGKARSMTAPLPAGQLRAMRRAYAVAGFGPETVGLFEAHGTGTVAGDTAELESTTRLVRESGGRPHRAVVGSVKTMIGHTKATAGIAGLIKAALSLHHRVLPPHRGVQDPNAVLREADCPVRLVDQALPWLARPDQPRRAAVSAFGFGGTNFHVVMEEYAAEYRPWLRPTTAKRWPAEVFLWGAADAEALMGDLQRLQQQLLAPGKTIILRDLAAGLASRYQTGTQTLAIVARHAGDLSEKLTATLAVLRGATSPLPPGVYRNSLRLRTSSEPTENSSDRGKVAVVFAGQGSQYPEMLRELMLHFPVCADTLSRADAILESEFEARFGQDRVLSSFIFPRGRYDAQAKSAAALALTQTDVAQPALGAVDGAMFHLMDTLGLRPDMFAGHSFGEFVALYAGGAIDFDSMLKLSAARGRSIVDAAKAAGAELGTMAAVSAPREQVERAIAGLADVVIANHNAPNQSILSGSRAAIQEATTKLAQQGVRVSEFPVAAAFHSPLVMPAQQALAEVIEATPWRPTTVPVYSNTTAKPHIAEIDATRRAMANHLVRPVEFVAQIEAMYEAGARIFLELGPKSVQSRLVGAILDGRPHLALSIDSNGGLEGFLAMLAQLICAGVELGVAKLFEGRATPVADPYQLPDAPVPPKHAWVINGSGVRRVGEPAKQVGVTHEQLQPRPSTPVLASEPVTPRLRINPTTTSPSAVTATPIFRRTAPPSTPLQTVRSAPTMSEHDPTTMNGYFAMMRQFLETQERVMGMYMRASTGAQPVHTSLPPERMLQPRMAPMPMPTPSRPVAIAKPPEGQPAIPQPPVVAPSPSPVLPVVQVEATPKAEPTASPGLDRSKMTELLLGIVEEKTGYPRDMVGLTQNLESDLGIDSIKRIEVVGAMLEFLPEVHRKALASMRGQINTQPTLEGMLNILGSVNGNSHHGNPHHGNPNNGASIHGSETRATLPFDVAEAGVATEIGHLPRYLVVAREQAVDVHAVRRIRQGHFVVTEDLLGVAEILAERLLREGCTIHRVPRETLADEGALLRWIREASVERGTLGGIVHLAPLGVHELDLDGTLEHWRRELQLHEKSLFLLLREFSDHLADDGHVLAASSLGGWFGRDDKPARVPAKVSPGLQGGAVGLLKSHSEERPTLRVKAVDIDPHLFAETIAANLFDELSLVGGRQEIGYPEGRRTAFHTIAASVETSVERAMPREGRVVLGTGGARGVTAELLRELAVPGNTLILTGRRPLPEAETAELAALTSATELRNHFIAQVRQGASRLTPGEIGRTVQTILAAREARNNIEDFRRRGAIVEYHPVDVTDEPALQTLLVDLRTRLGGVSGVVHGAGIIEDKRVVDKTSESWSRVVETKVMSLLLLQKHLRPDQLEFFVVMSSVAGRYGNSGQADYATANELMNRLCCQLRSRWQGAVNVMALCWGPWGPTTFGAGMVNAETEAKFAAKGVRLVSAAVGRRLFADELQRRTDDRVEIVCGEGPWEERESVLGKFELEMVRSQGISRVKLGPLLGDAQVEVEPKGDQIVSLRLDSNHAYLNAHRIDAVPVLPAAAAVELFAEAVARLWPTWKVVEVRDCRLLKGIDLKGSERALEIVVSPPVYGSSEGFEVHAVLRSAAEGSRPARTHYRGVVRVAQQFPEDFEAVHERYAERQISVAKAYDEWLFHGDCFRVIEQFAGLSKAGARALVRASKPSEWLRNATERDRWIFDPALVDAGPQMAIVMARCFRDETVLPARFGRIVRYREVLPERMQMVFECVPVDDPSRVRANVYYLDVDNRVVMLIEDLEGVGSAALNRLAVAPSLLSNLSLSTN